MADRQIRRYWYAVALLCVAAIATQLATQWETAGVFFRGFSFGCTALALVLTWVRFHRFWDRPTLPPPPPLVCMHCKASPREKDFDHVCPVTANGKHVWWECCQ